MRALRDSGLVLLSLGLLLHLLSVASPYWREGDNGDNTGLWLDCGPQSCIPFITLAPQQSGFLHAVQGLVLGGAVVAVIAICTIIWSIRKRKVSSNKKFPYFPGVITLVAGFVVGLGLVVYAVEELPDDGVLGWIFYLDCAALLALAFASGLLLGAAYKERKDSELERLESYFSSPSQLEFNLTDWTNTHL